MYDLDYYDQINQEEAEQANRLADILNWIYKPKSVLDIGSATGLYLKPYLDIGIKVTGVDFSISAVSAEVLKIPRKMIKTADITKTPIGVKADLTLCIEVMEHIDAEHAEISIHNIAKTTDTIFFTAAQPGQGGVGHINCQPKEYWDTFFTNEGFVRDNLDEEYIRILMNAGYRMGWLINNLMVFKREKKPKKKAV